MRILVVKGANPRASELRQALRELGPEVDVVSCPREAEAKARETRYDAVVLDLMVVVGSAPGAALEGGTLTTPDEVQGLLARLAPLVGREAPAAAVLRAHDLEIDTGARRATRSGHPIHLTDREFDILQLLARNKGKLVTHRAIRTAVWGDEAMHHTIIGTYIARVREKVDRGHAEELILTRWGRGYMMRGDG